VIARWWRGAVRRSDADRYIAYVVETGVADYTATAGNLAVLVLRRDDGDRTEIGTLTLWDSLDAIRAFAGDDVERARFYPQDDEFLVERGERATHYDVAHARGVGLDLAQLGQSLLARWPSPDQEDELERSGGELGVMTVPTTLGDARCGFRADDDGDTYAFLELSLPQHWTNESGTYDEPLRLRFYGSDALPDIR
jgi:heme-degrading monooxygenase HmoA